MPLLTLLLTSPFLLIANDIKQETERLFPVKVFSIWLLSLVYIAINDNFRLPIGIICAIPIVYKANNNRKSKLAALFVGIISLLLSSLTYSPFKI